MSFPDAGCGDVGAGNCQSYYVQETGQNRNPVYDWNSLHEEVTGRSQSHVDGFWSEQSLMPIGPLLVPEIDPNRNHAVV